MKILQYLSALLSAHNFLFSCLQTSLNYLVASGRDLATDKVLQTIVNQILLCNCCMANMHYHHLGRVFMGIASEPEHRGMTVQQGGVKVSPF